MIYILTLYFYSNVIVFLLKSLWWQKNSFFLVTTAKLRNLRKCTIQNSLGLYVIFDRSYVIPNEKSQHLFLKES